MSQSSNHNWFLEYENDSNCLYSHQIQIQLITFGNPVRYIYIYIYIYIVVSDWSLYLEI